VNRTCLRCRKPTGRLWLGHYPGIPSAAFPFVPPTSSRRSSSRNRRAALRPAPRPGARFPASAGARHDLGATRRHGGHQTIQTEAARRGARSNAAACPVLPPAPPVEECLSPNQNGELRPGSNTDLALCPAIHLLEQLSQGPFGDLYRARGRQRPRTAGSLLSRRKRSGWCRTKRLVARLGALRHPALPALETEQIVNGRDVLITDAVEPDPGRPLPGIASPRERKAFRVRNCCVP